MLAAIVDHLWQSTLIAVAAAGLAFALRRHAASVRYWIWFAAALKFVLPLAVLTALGAGLSWRVAEPARPGAEDRWAEIAARLVLPMGTMRQATINPDVSPASNGAGTMSPSAAPESSSKPFAGGESRLGDDDSAESSTLASGRRSLLSALAIVIWLVGTAGVVAVWSARYRRLRLLARNAVQVMLDLPEARGIEIRMTDLPIEPGLFGIRSPILLLPAGIVDRLSRDELAALICHERCHLERRDNLTALAPMLVAALFWFYPLVWWIGARLVDERERACDEAVLAASVAADTYARGILEVCALYVRSPLPCAAGVGGGRLSRRIAEVLSGRKSAALGAFPRIALLSLPLAVLALPFGAGLMTAAPALAQSRPVDAPTATTQPVDSPIVITSEIFMDSVIFTPSLWLDTGRPVRLFQAYRNELSPANWFGRARTATTGPAFGIRLTGCPAIRPFAIEPTDPDVGPPPSLTSLADLVAYGFDLDADLVVLPESVSDTGVWLVTDPRASIRHGSCRSFVRRALEEDHALATRFMEPERRLVVERLDLPEPLPEIRRQSLTAYRISPVEVEPAVLDAYTGHFARPYAASRFFAPVFEIRRQEGALVVIWNEDPFVVQPMSESEFMTIRDLKMTPPDEGRRNGLASLPGFQPLISDVSLSFLSTDEVRIASGEESHDPASRWDFARRVDVATAAAIRDDIQNRYERQQSAPAAEALVREIVALLYTDEPLSDTPAATAAGEIRSYVQLNDPGRIQLRGALRSIALREVLPSGREIHDVVFDGLALQLDVGAAGPVGVEALAFDITCRRRNSYEIDLVGPCTAPAAASTAR